MTRTIGNLLCISAIAVALGTDVGAQESQRQSLAGSWWFAIDPLESGLEHGWHAPDPASIGSGWDPVEVPHAWPTDPRYQYTGTAWYRRNFPVPANWAGEHVRLVFDAAFYRSRAWVNGAYLGDHEGGYTPFSFDATPYLRPGGENTIVVAVDNSWDLTTLPGARPGNAPSRQVYPWWDYGGLVREVYLLATDPLYVEKQRVVAEPDLGSGTAAVEATVWVANASDQPKRAVVGLELRREGREEILVGWRGDSGLRATIDIPARSTRQVHLRAGLPAGQVALWHPDQPHLYEARALVRAEGEEDGAHAQRATFGIREVEIRDARLLLNGEPIRMGGGNRPSDHPRTGLVEPDSVVFRDLRMMKEAGMELSRINHYASPKNLLEWTDRNGMLIIPEAGNWQLAPEQMDDPVIRANFQRQMREMVERDWNHPSVIGWSVGNEYAADDPAGVRWTRDMSDFVRALDDSRLTLFVSLGNALSPSTLPREERSLHYSDLLAVNLYSPPGQLGEGLDRLHDTWPDKPILITEFGQRADQSTAAERVDYVRDFMEVIRERPYVAGASVWTFNDYRSRYPGTNPNGYRWWGVVDEERRPRPMYFTLREAFSPVELSGSATRTASGAVRGRFRLSARDDFPHYTLRDYRVRYQLRDAAERVLHEETRALAALRPGEAIDLSFVAPAADAAEATAARVEVVRPTGFTVADRTVEVAAEP